VTTVVIPANPVTLALSDLATCLCAQIVADGLPDVCFCGVIPGEAASAMYQGNCAKKCGMAWVRLITVTPASGVGNPSEQPGNCATGIGYDAEVGILRCTPIGTATEPPTPAQLLASAELQYNDMMSTRRAVSCCTGSRDWKVGAYTPMGPGGGMVGGAWTVTMWSP
jgi:hypothetical protein